MQNQERKEGVRSLQLRNSWPRANSLGGASVPSATARRSHSACPPGQPDWEQYWDELEGRINHHSLWPYWAIFWLFVGFLSLQLCWQEKLLEMQKKILNRLGDVRKRV